MEIKLTNENYHGKVVEIKNIIPIEGKDRIVSTDIFGSNVIISNEVKVGDMGIFFPAETQLNSEYLSYNSLYRDSTKNRDTSKKGFFEDNGRIKCLSLGKTPSMGLFMPFASLEYIKNLDLKLGDKFNEINGKDICRKYVIKIQNTPSQGLGKNGKKARKIARISKLVEDQFRLHYDSGKLGDNIHLINPDEVCTISYKAHGTSAVFSNILCKRKLNIFEKALKLLGVKVQDTEYDYVYASRNTVKNSDMVSSKQIHYYGTDIWGVVNEEIKTKIPKGMTIYGEIVGYTGPGSAIQKMKGKTFDYGCEDGKHEFYAYRVTYTNPDGLVYEFSMKQVHAWCEENGIKCVPILYHGQAKNILSLHEQMNSSIHFHDNLLRTIKERWNEKDCYICKNVVPEEGCVIRVEGKSGAWKQKSFKFLRGESEQLDTGEVDIESQQEA